MFIVAFVLLSVGFIRGISSFDVALFIVTCLLGILIASAGGSVVAIALPFILILLTHILKNMDWKSLNINKILQTVILVYLTFGLLWVIHPGVANLVQSILVRTINGEVGYRGIPLLSTEPGLAAGLLVILAELCLVAPLKNTRLFAFVFILLALSTKSGSALVYIGIFLILRLNKKNVIMSIIPVVLLINVSIDLGRMSGTIDRFKTLEISTIFLDTSIAYRWTAFNFGFNSAIMHPISYQNRVAYVNEEYQIFRNRYNEYMDKDLHPVSAIGNYCVYGGVVFLAWLALLVIYLGWNKYFLYYFLTMSFSYSLLFPVPLILIIYLNYVRCNMQISK